MQYYFAILIKLIPFICSLAKVAEVAFSTEKAGSEKKLAVKDGLTAMFDGVKEASTGGQKETFEKVEPLFDAVIDKGIDLATTMLFKK